MKKLLVCLALGVASLSMAGCNNTGSKLGSDKVGKTTIAKVGDTEIDIKSLDKEMTRIKQSLELQYGADYEKEPQVKELLKEQKKQIVNYLVEVEVIKQKAKEMNIEVNEEDVQAQIDDIKAQFASEQEFTDALKEQGMTIEQIKEQLQISKLMQQTAESVTKDIKITDEEIKDYYDQNKEEYKREPGGYMYHILVPTEEEAKKIKDESDKGESFENLAKKYGTDGTKDVGGALGYVAYEDPNYDQDFLAGAKKLEEGKVSDPVKSSFGWHLIKVESIQKEAGIANMEDVKDEIRDILRQGKEYDAYKNYIENAKKEIGVKIYEDRF